MKTLMEEKRNTVVIPAAQEVARIIALAREAATVPRVYLQTSASPADPCRGPSLRAFALVDYEGRFSIVSIPAHRIEA